MRTLKALSLCPKPLETESLAEVWFVIDSCRLVNQSNYLNSSNKSKERAKSHVINNLHVLTCVNLESSVLMGKSQTLAMLH